LEEAVERKSFSWPGNDWSLELVHCFIPIGRNIYLFIIIYYSFAIEHT